MLVVFSSGVVMLWDWKRWSKKYPEKCDINVPDVSCYIKQLSRFMLSFYNKVHCTCEDCDSLAYIMFDMHIYKGHKLLNK